MNTIGQKFQAYIQEDNVLLEKKRQAQCLFTNDPINLSGLVGKNGGVRFFSGLQGFSTKSVAILLVEPDKLVPILLTPLLYLL